MPVCSIFRRSIINQIKCAAAWVKLPNHPLFYDRKIELVFAAFRPHLQITAVFSGVLTLFLFIEKT